jgi:hypothetical protein
MNAGIGRAGAGGFTLLDVVLAILVFAVGMLALASLQTNLTRSAVDSNARTVAVNIGEEIIEGLRSFQRIDTDPDGAIFAFADIVDGTVSVAELERGGVNYSIDADVWGYNFADDGTGLEDPVEAVAGAIYDFKRVDLTISFVGNPGFQVDDDTTLTADQMNTGSVTLQAIIPGSPVLASGKINADLEGPSGPLVNYTPGQRPDIIRLGLNLDGNRFKESTKPAPEIIRSEGRNETWFDVITYNTNNGNTFLRREEFLVLSCECTLRNPIGTESTGFKPTIWTGTEYSTQGEMVRKQYGESTATLSGVDYCETCCRDHHDNTDVTGLDPNNTEHLDAVYDPARLINENNAWTEAGTGGNHAHYKRSKKGVLTVAGPNDTYVEACRMVRHDGFMRVAQDFRQEGLLAFPEGYLDTDNADVYANYVVNAVSDFYVKGRTELTPPSGDAEGQNPWAPYIFPGTDANPTSLPFPAVGGVNSQQMRSRAIYIDRLGTDAKALIDCLYANDDLADPGAACVEFGGEPGISSYLEAYPFLEVQTTWLSWWNVEPTGGPVSVSSDPVETYNLHDRGVATLVNVAAPKQTALVTTDMHRGNIGLAVADPIGPRDAIPNDAGVVPEFDYTMTVNVNGGGAEGANPDSYVWTGTFESAVNGLNAADAALEVNNTDTFCSRSGTAIGCLTKLGAPSGSITISGYYKNAGTDLWVCVDGIEGVDVVNEPYGTAKQATITWPHSWTPEINLEGVSISIESSACPDPAAP